MVKSPYTFRCPACGEPAKAAGLTLWDAWCVPCQTRIKFETPWWAPGLNSEQLREAEDKWKLEHREGPTLELKGCPFCGREQREGADSWKGPTLHTVKGGGYAIKCTCGATGPHGWSLELAVKDWNRRLPNG